MFRHIALCLFLLWPLSVVADNKLDLEATMKNMGLALKQAREADSPRAAKPYIEQLILLTEQATTARFADDKAQLYLEGLQKVQLT